MRRSTPLLLVLGCLVLRSAELSE